MQTPDQDRFTFDLANLPTGEFVKLSDALHLAFFGGVPSVRYEGPIRLPAELDREYAITNTGEWLLITEGVTLLGPKYVDIPNPGSILFGIEDNSTPDQTQLAAAEAEYQARVERYQRRLEDEAIISPSSEGRQMGPSYSPPPRRFDFSKIDGFWRAEIGRRRATFFGVLNAAARAGNVRFMGSPVSEAWIQEPSIFGATPQDIPSAYFVEGRSFDEDSCIHAIGEDTPEPDCDGATDSGRYVSYRDVVVERASYLRFLKTHYPAVLKPDLAGEQRAVHEAKKLLTHALREANDLTKADAAKLVGWRVSNRRFSDEIWPDAREAAGLPRRAPPGRKGKVGSFKPNPQSEQI